MTETTMIVCDQFLTHSPEDVWRALTDPDLLARWWVPGDVQAEVGHRFNLDMGKWGQQPCEVTAVEPGRLFAYRFGGGSIDTTITWRVEPEGTGTRLLLEHTGFDLDSPLGRQAYEGMGAGWPHVLERIDGAIDAIGVGVV